MWYTKLKPKKTFFIMISKSLTLIQNKEIMTFHHQLVIIWYLCLFQVAHFYCPLCFPYRTKGSADSSLINSPVSRSGNKIISKWSSPQASLDSSTTFQHNLLKAHYTVRNLQYFNTLHLFKRQKTHGKFISVTRNKLNSLGAFSGEICIVSISNNRLSYFSPQEVNLP